MLVERVVNRERAHRARVTMCSPPRVACWSVGAASLPGVVEDERGARVVGLLRHRDAFAATYGRADRPALAAVMSAPACTCRASDSLGVAVRLLRRSGMDAVPVLDGEGYLVGVLSFADLVREAAR